MPMVQSETNTLSRSSLGSVTGQIWLQLGGEGFPELGWSDFPVVILGWWTQALSRLLSGSETSVECLFMDGPFAFVLTRISDDLLEVRAGPRDADRALLDRVGMVEFVADVRRAAEGILRACAARGWDSRDIATLQREVDALKAIQA